MFDATYDSLAANFGNIRFLGTPGFWRGCTTASALISTILGSLAGRQTLGRLGPEKTLSVLAILYFVSAVGSGTAWDWWSFVIARFLGGLAVGGSSVVGPVYIAEISPAANRGRLVALFQFNIVFGILLAFLSNYTLGTLNLGDIEWRWIFAVKEAFPAAAFFLLLFGNPRSPRLADNEGAGRRGESRSSADRYRRRRGRTPCDSGIDRPRSSPRQEPFFRKKYLRPILLAFLIAMFNQLSGINALLYYSQQIFEMAGAASATPACKA